MKSVLIAEDDRYIREGLVELLGYEGFECLEADNGNAAVELFNLNKFDLVLLDIMMPGMDGYNVCKLIRKQDESIPVIFITAKSEEIDQVLGLELGADDYIFKPFGTREVIARIRAVMRRSIHSNNHEEERVVPLGEYQFHIDKMRLQAGNKIIDLTLRDSKILTLLYQNRGKVVDRDALFNYCWGRDYYPDSRTLDQHISQLRKRIEKDHKNPEIIKTIRGVGYRYDG